MPSDKEYYESVEIKFGKDFPYELGAFFALFSQLEAVFELFIHHLMKHQHISSRSFFFISRKLSMQDKLDTWKTLYYGEFIPHNPKVPKWERLFDDIGEFTKRRNELAHRRFVPGENGSVYEVYISMQKTGWNEKRERLDVEKLKQTNKDMLEALSDLHRIIPPPTKKS